MPRQLDPETVQAERVMFTLGGRSDIDNASSFLRDILNDTDAPQKLRDVAGKKAPSGCITPVSNAPPASSDWETWGHANLLYNTWSPTSLVHTTVRAEDTHTSHSPCTTPYLYPSNDTFVATLIGGQRVRIGHGTNANIPGSRTKWLLKHKCPLSNQHAKVWEENGKILIEDVMRSNGTPPGMSGLSFDYILSCLQGELQKSRETGAELHSLTTAIDDIHDTLGGAMTQASQASLATHVDNVRALEDMLAEHEAIKQEVASLRELMDVRKRELEIAQLAAGSPSGYHPQQSEASSWTRKVQWQESEMPK
ncbi:hypothetical protein OG21DRAFT_1490148 [Imleria badia]|nr:hypothetical protein OG21DRAFT_1490148 [Imleria badia]